MKSWARIPLPFRIENSQRTILNVLNYVHWNSLLSGSLKFTYYFLFLNGPIPASFFIFHYFLITISIIQIEKKCRWCAWDLNPGPQDDRRRQNHGAMAATQARLSLHYNVCSSSDAHVGLSWSNIKLDFLTLIRHFLLGTTSTFTLFHFIGKKKRGAGNRRFGKRWRSI